MDEIKALPQDDAQLRLLGQIYNELEYYAEAAACYEKIAIKSHKDIKEWYHLQKAVKNYGNTHSQSCNTWQRRKKQTKENIKDALAATVTALVEMWFKVKKWATLFISTSMH